MHDFKKKLRVRTLFNEMPKVSINKGFSESHLSEILPFKCELNESLGTPFLTEIGMSDSSQLYNYKLAAEFPKMIKQNLASKPHPITKCFHHQSNKIIDLTCGEGRDSLQLLLSGYHVTAYERVPEIAAFFLCNLFKLSQVMKLPLENFEYVIGDWKDDDQLLSSADQFYYDPMFIPTKRKALPRGTIQLFESLSADNDQVDRAQWLYDNLKGRLVIKRQPKIEPIIAKKTFEITSKLVRFDVYERS